MNEYVCKAIIYKAPEDVYGPCGCGMDMAIFPMLLPKTWLLEENPSEVSEHGFCEGFDVRRLSGMACNRVLDYKDDGVEFFANFSCCYDCAERAVSCGYAVWSDEEYPMILR